MIQPKISIVFTSYNHKEYLEEALDSLINQSFTDFELIIIDDCSTDGSQLILKKYETDLRVKLHLLEKNSGSYVHSSNLGASKAIGKYILFAQCDDFAELNQLEKLYFEIERNPSVSVVYSSSTMIDKHGCNIGSDFDCREAKFKRQCAVDTLVTGKQMMNYFLSSCVIPNLSAALIKRSYFENVKGLSPAFVVLADWDFWLKMTLECDFFYLREPLNNFRQHDTTIRNTIKMKRQINELFLMYFNFISNSKFGFRKRISIEYNLSIVWLSFFRSGKIDWLKSFIDLQLSVTKYSVRFPIVFIIATVIFPFALIRNKITNILLNKGAI